MAHRAAPDAIAPRSILWRTPLAFPSCAQLLTLLRSLTDAEYWAKNKASLEEMDEDELRALMVRGEEERQRRDRQELRAKAKKGA